MTKLSAITLVAVSGLLFTPFGRLQAAPPQNVVNLTDSSGQGDEDQEELVRQLLQLLDPDAVDPGVMPEGDENETDSDEEVPGPHGKAFGRLKKSGGTFQSLGPTKIAGRVRAIVVRPDDPDTIWLAAATGGLWVSRNAGGTWTNADDFLQTLTFSSLTLDRANPNVMYAGSGEIFTFLHHLPSVGMDIGAIENLTLRSPRRGTGIFKTTDGGNTWNLLSSTSTSNFFYVNRIAIHPTNPNILLAGTATGMWRSENAGASWTNIPTLDGIIVLDVKFPPSAFAVPTVEALAGTYNRGAFHSIDGLGLTWFPSLLPGSLVTSTPANTRIELARANPGEWLAAYIKGGGTNDGITMLISNNRGSSFDYLNGRSAPITLDNGTYPTNKVDNNNLYTGALWVDPRFGSHIVVGGVRLALSEDGGVTFTQLTGTTLHSDNHAIVEHPSINLNRTIYLGTDGGFGRIENYNTSPAPVNLNTNLGIQQFYGAVKNPISGIIVGGTQDIGRLRRDPTGAWTPVLSSESDATMVATDPTDGNFFYYGKSGARLYRSRDGGANSECIVPSMPTCDDGLDSGFNITPILLDPSNPNVLYAGCARLWRTKQVKTSDPTDIRWRVIKPASGAHVITTMAVAAYNPNLMWIGTLRVQSNVLRRDRELWMTTTLQSLPDLAANSTDASGWTNLSIGSNLPMRPISRIALHPTDPTLVYVSFAGWASDTASSNLWKGAQQPNGTYVWTDISAGLPPGPVYSVSVHPNPAANGWLYAGTDVGVYRSTDNGRTWSATTIGPARVPIADLSWVDPLRLTPFVTNYNRLIVATYGRGVFEMDETPNPERVIPEAVSYTRGQQSGGHTENLLENDGRALVSSKPIFGSGIMLELVGRSGFGRSLTLAKGASFACTLESSASRSFGSLKSPILTIELFNFSTRVYEQKFSGGVPTTDKLISVSGNNRDFISATREVRVRLTWANTATSQIDSAKWVIKR